ncbi:DNA-binding protein [Mycobacterium vulneris]|jgi:amino acid transporter|uniref:DNA-binding protein n=1 Tax=Mycolicibacterium vulneris TaxID=547163 RepID=A0A1X2L740_9MYCO|nr:amino acid permease [Mycolicibacterium vulneris]OSC29747.1 DNA-binding protein [Mycolicibacterium vulneris]
MRSSTDRLGVSLSIGDVGKRLFLGKPLISEHLESESLSNVVALGALSPDAISSTVYGPEQIMVELLPAAGLAAYVLVLPIAGVILLILALVTGSYRQVVMAYTQRGGSYVVARANFGPRVAQLSAAALLIDYVVTVAVQCASGTFAVVSAVPSLGPYHLEITVVALLLIAYANLRGLREAGRIFAVPVYSFIVMLTVMIVTGVVREAFWGLPQYDPAHIAGAVPVHQGNGLVMGATILVLLRAFANGGTSLTGVESIADAVNIFRKPQGVNARRVLTAMACVLGFLLVGVIYLVHVTHATPFVAEYPSMLSEVARAVFGTGVIGSSMYWLLQTASAAILFFGANTSFNGFPALTSFIAEDSFLPRPLVKRGHRLVFSNAIITLTALALILLLVTGGSVDAIVPLFAMGVFTGFSMAGYGMTKHHLAQRGPGWRHKLVINLSAGILSTIVVGIFAVAKFTEGAWLVVVVMPALVFVLMRLNRRYRAEATVLKTSSTEPPGSAAYTRHRVFVFVDSVDLAEIAALRYGKSLHPDELTAVHFVLDAAHAAELAELWDRFDQETPLRLIDCPDRHLSRAAQELVLQALGECPETEVTALLPRRTYAPLVGRLLHDRTADKMSRAISRLPGVVALIVPYDTGSRIAQATAAGFEQRIARRIGKVLMRISRIEEKDHSLSPAVISVAGLVPGRRATIEGWVRRVEDISEDRRTSRWILVGDDSGEVRVTLHPGHGETIQPGQLLRVTAEARRNGNEPMSMVDPTYQVVE